MAKLTKQQFQESFVKAFKQCYITLWRCQHPDQKDFNKYAQDVYHTLEDRSLNDDTDTIDFLLEQLNPAELDVELILAILHITKLWRHKLNNRTAFYTKAVPVIEASLIKVDKGGLIESLQ